jgi:3-methylfumaryl-CoA hydratase
MLDLEPNDVTTGMALPRGWHFALLSAETRRSALRNDGFPGLGVPMPDLGLPRLMLGGRTVHFIHDIPIGATVMRKSAVQSIVHKNSASGPFAVVKLGHELTLASQQVPALIETQTYLLLPARVTSAYAPEATPEVAIQAPYQKTAVPDQTQLFQYSSLGFNSHRIHTDRGHARLVEGYPDLVVNGGLSTLFLTEFLRLDLGVTPAAVAIQHVAPLYCDRSITLTAEQSGDRWLLQAFDNHQRLAVSMNVDAS